MVDDAAGSADRDIEFAMKAVEKGFIIPEILPTVFGRLSDARHLDRRVSMGSLLVELEMLTPAQVKEILQELGTTNLVCTSPACARVYKVRAFDSSRKYKCKQCGAPLAPENPDDAGDLRRAPGGRPATRQVQAPIEPPSTVRPPSDPELPERYGMSVPDDMLPDAPYREVDIPTEPEKVGMSGLDLQPVAGMQPMSSLQVDGSIKEAEEVEPHRDAPPGILRQAATDVNAAPSRQLRPASTPNTPGVPRGVVRVGAALTPTKTSPWGLVFGILFVLTAGAAGFFAWQWQDALRQLERLSQQVGGGDARPIPSTSMPPDNAMLAAIIAAKQAAQAIREGWGQEPPDTLATALESAIAQNVDIPQFHWLKGDLLTAAGDIAAASTAYAQGFRLAESQPETTTAAEIASMRLAAALSLWLCEPFRSPDLSAAHLRDAIDRDPASPIAAAAQALLALQNGDRGAAEEFLVAFPLNAAPEGDVDTWELDVATALIRVQGFLGGLPPSGLEDASDAADLLETVAQDSAGRYELPVLRAVALGELPGHASAAVRAWQEILSRWGRRMDWRYRFALALYRDGDRAAQSELDAVIADYPDYVRPRVLRGIVRMEVGNVEGAEEDFELALAVMRTDPDAVWAAAEFARQQGHFQHAIDLLTSLRGQNRAWETRHAVLLARARLDKARPQTVGGSWEAAEAEAAATGLDEIDLAGTDRRMRSTILALQGVAQLAVAETRSAERLCDDAVQWDGGNTLARLCRAEVYLAIGSPDRAVNDCRIVTGMRNPHWRAFALMGLAYTSLREKQSALDQFSRAADLAPAYMAEVLSGYRARAEALPD